ncbi:MAG: aldehyde dehydrogenase family protein [Pseudomonadota bacterium]
MSAGFKLLIDGRLVDGATEFDVINPATGVSFAKCPKADIAQLNEAVAAAKSAFRAWSTTSIETRAEKVSSLATALEARAEEFAKLLTSEQGKPFNQAMQEVMGGVSILSAFSRARLDDKIIRENVDATIIEHRTPLGVVAAITPWNFPLALLMNKIGPALVAGNAVVAKPAPTTPLTTLLFAALANEILPAGVLNVICDENDLGAALTAHPDVRKVSFTGSTATGKKVMGAAADTIKRVTLELGGNDAAIILDDVDVAAVAAKVFQSAMANAGQICVATKRVYVPSSLYNEFCNALATIADSVVVGNGLQDGVQMGPLQNQKQYDKVCAIIHESASLGEVIAGGEPLKRDGYFVPPTIVRNIPDDAALVREEQFGPVLPILAYDDLDELIDRVNASAYGLGGSIWSGDVQRAIGVAKRIDSGTVWVNQFLAMDPDIPFRGSKQSGIGAELGEEGLFEYTQPHIINALTVSA